MVLILSKTVIHKREKRISWLIRKGLHGLMWVLRISRIQEVGDRLASSCKITGQKGCVCEQLTRSI